MIMDTYQILIDLFKELKNLVTKEKEKKLIEKATGLLNLHQGLFEYTEKNSNKLLEYELMLEDYTMWKSKEQYFKVTNNFVNSSISGDEFCDIF
jgi:hypothetical protein